MKTYGYDYVLALTSDAVTDILSGNLHDVRQTIDHTTVDADSGTTIALSARVAPWQMMAGGGNSLIRFAMPFTEGTLSFSGGALPSGTHDVAGVVPVVEMSLGWVGVGTAQRATGSGGDTRLVFDPHPAAEAGDPGYVHVVEVRDPDGKLGTLAVAMLEAFLTEALLANRDTVATVLADVQPSPASLAPWLHPCSWRYFVYAPVAGPHMLCFLCTLDDAAPPTQPAFDASRLTAGANAVIAVSQVAMFRGAVLPAVAGALPGGDFRLDADGDRASIVNQSPFSVGSVTANRYSLTANAAGDGLAVSAGGGGPLSFLFGAAKLPNASYSWSLGTNNPMVRSGSDVVFASDPNPTKQQDHNVPWYDWALLVAIGIANIASLVATIYDCVNQFSDQAQKVGISEIGTNLQSSTGHSVLHLANTVQLAHPGSRFSSATQTFVPAAVGMSECLYLTGTLSGAQPITNHP